MTRAFASAWSRASQFAKPDRNVANGRHYHAFGRREVLKRAGNTSRASESFGTRAVRVQDTLRLPSRRNTLTLPDEFSEQAEGIKVPSCV